jgi:hypothetical protein
VGGFCAETGGALTLFLATALGIPVSTTHTITGAIVGVGSAQRASAVRWGVAGNIVWAWIIMIPASAFVAAIAYWVSLADLLSLVFFGACLEVASAPHTVVPHSPSLDRGCLMPCDRSVVQCFSAHLSEPVVIAPKSPDSIDGL